MIDACDRLTRNEESDRTIEEQGQQSFPVQVIIGGLQYIYDTSTVDIQHSESTFGATVVGPIVKAMCKELYEEYNTAYYPGEEKLDALHIQLKMIDPSVDRRHGYNADNIVRGSNSGVEIFVSEASSRYGAEKKDKHATGHYKGMFAQLSMLKAVADKHEHAKEETMLKQKVSNNMQVKPDEEMDMAIKQENISKPKTALDNNKDAIIDPLFYCSKCEKYLSTKCSFKHKANTCISGQ